MQVLSPAEFSWKVLSANNSPQVSAFDPQRAFRSPTVNQAHIAAPLFRSPSAAGSVPQSAVFSVPPSAVFPVPPNPPSPPNPRFEQLGNQVKFLEAEVHRMTEELRVRSGTISKSRVIQERLVTEVEDLKDEVSRLRSVLRARDKHIEELEKQLSLSQSQLVLMKRRYRAAVEAASTVTPGTIKHVTAEQRSIGMQAGDIQGLEQRMSKLVIALRDEKQRNKRIKNMLSNQADFGDSSVPPLPDDNLRNFFRRRPLGLVSRGTSTPAAITKSKPKLSVESASIASIGGSKNGLRLSNSQQFLEIHINGSAPPLHQLLSLDSPVNNTSHAMSEISPINFRKDTSFSVYDDQRSNVLTNSNFTVQKRRPNDIKQKNSSAVSTVPSMRPPKIDVPRLNLPKSDSHDQSHVSSGRSSASEAAIRRAVAAAIQKRRSNDREDSFSSISGTHFGGRLVGV